MASGNNDKHYEYASSTMQKTRYIISLMFNRACEEERMFIKTNPLKNSDFMKPMAKKERKVITGFSDVETSILCEALKTLPHAYPVVVLQLATGMRIEEVLALRWKSINMENGTILIDRAITTEYDIDTSTGEKISKSRTILAKPKTSSSQRMVRISDSILGVIEEWKRYAKEQTKTKFSPDDFVFGNFKGASWTVNGFRNSVNKHLQKEGAAIQTCAFHRARHRAATRLRNNGCSTLDIKDQLGHATIQMTEDYIDKNTEVVMRKTGSLLSDDLERIVGDFEEK